MGQPFSWFNTELCKVLGRIRTRSVENGLLLRRGGPWEGWLECLRFQLWEKEMDVRIIEGAWYC